jgi:hypothetical protein
MRARNREPWNDEDYATLHRMAAAGGDLMAIGRALERSSEAVAKKARALNIAVTPRGRGQTTPR